MVTAFCCLGVYPLPVLFNSLLFFEILPILSTSFSLFINHYKFKQMKATKTKAQTKAQSNTKQSKATAKQTKSTAKQGAKAISEASKESRKIEVYLADGITSGMIQRSLQTINQLHKADAGGYMYCLKRWLKFADATNFFSQFKSVTAEEISKLPNLADFRSEYEKKLFAKSGKYSVWLIGQLVKRYAKSKG